MHTYTHKNLRTLDIKNKIRTSKICNLKLEQIDDLNLRVEY